MNTIIVNGTCYDITSFKHPGGSVIRYYTQGADASEPFREFHRRSKKANKVLKALPLASTIPTSISPDNELSRIRKELEQRGFFKPDYVHVMYRLLELFSIFVMGQYMLRFSYLVHVLIISLFSVRCGWFQHECGHNSMTGNIWLDKRFQSASMGLGLVTSASKWNQMHNKHHATPQKIGHDIDLDTTPLVAFFEDALHSNRPRPYSKTWLKYQAWTFVPLTSGVFVMAFWVLVLHPMYCLKNRKYEDAFWMIMGHALLKIPFASLSIAGMILFFHFALSHTHTPVTQKNEQKSWRQYAFEHTVDIATNNWFVTWFMGYLNCQVVHHLFPSMPQFRQPIVSKELKKRAEYQHLTYFQAVYRTFQNLHTVGQKLKY